MTLQNSTNRNQAPVRQTVSNGSVDSNGFPNALSIGSGLAVTLTTTTPFELSFSAGFNNGAIDYPGRFTTNQTFLGLTASTTCYLYVDRDPVTGALSLGFSTIAPQYLTTAGTQTTDQHWFDLNAFTMKRWNGSAWIVFQRVFIGEAATGASSVTSVTTYAYQGFYQSLWVSVAANTVYNFNHNLGISLSAASANIQIFGSVAGNNADAYLATPYVYVMPYGYGYAPKYTAAPAKTLALTTKDYPLRNNSDTFVTSGYYRVNCNRGW